MKKNSNSVKLIIKRLLTALTAKSLVVKVLGALGMSKHLIFPGAEEGTRTPTGICLLDPEPSASTSSATSARVGHKKIDLLTELIYLYGFIFLVKFNITRDEGTNGAYS